MFKEAYEKCLKKHMRIAYIFAYIWGLVDTYIYVTLYSNQSTSNLENGDKRGGGHKLLRRLWTGPSANFKGPIPIFNLLLGRKPLHSVGYIRTLDTRYSLLLKNAIQDSLSGTFQYILLWWFCGSVTRNLSD